MLKHRVIPTLLYKDTALVKGVGFDSWRIVGAAMQAVRIYNMRDVDELIFLDITATRQRRSPDMQLVQDLAKECFMPLAVGGGISSTEDVRSLLKSGADKVVVNSALMECPDLIQEAAIQFGNQSIIASIDCKLNDNMTYNVFTESGTRPTAEDPISHARNAEKLGAGEIMICNIDRDGTFNGYDLELIKAIAQEVSVPVIASGGAGEYSDFEDALKAGASAVAAASMFHFTEQTPLEARNYLAQKGYPVRT
ncbi:MAG: imidazole glycerol phosphate synthase subunit HisF [Alphaproteobacteria bacterium]